MLGRCLGASSFSLAVSLAVPCAAATYLAPEGEFLQVGHKLEAEADGPQRQGYAVHETQGLEGEVGHGRGQVLIEADTAGTTPSSLAVLWLRLTLTWCGRRFSCIPASSAHSLSCQAWR